MTLQIQKDIILKQAISQCNRFRLVLKRHCEQSQNTEKPFYQTFYLVELLENGQSQGRQVKGSYKEAYDLYLDLVESASRYDVITWKRETLAR